ncbi:TauD/TfdA dioxygenase family protein [Ilumatobacter nonamiensis]|uniref:TauD/TfdA dioxygenase family protein n=1 Tax=Ilumatobacter nonamiensis TaxID=467093 RepID=UPI000A0590FA|nr:TauD/TfdA family dioxygenase [Ilumatobacter nonamiensis]
MTITEPRPTSGATTISVTPQSPTIGAEIGGVDLAEDLSDQTIADIRQALLDWKVLFFRDQDITTEQHLAFGRRFGELEVHPFAPPHPEYAEVLRITHGEGAPGLENGWHSDVTWRVEPSLGSILRMLEGPAVGGDTLFADMYEAYEGLPDYVKEKVEGQTARHDFTRFKIGMRKQGAMEEEIAAVEERFPNPHHPVIRTHPETGRKAIYVNSAFTREIDDMNPDESEELLQILYRQASYPEYQVRLRWQPDTIAFWDNRSVQHYAVSDYYPQTRVVERVTVIGDTPYFDPDQAPTGLPPRPFRGQIERDRRGVDWRRQR